MIVSIPDLCTLTYFNRCNIGILMRESTSVTILLKCTVSSLLRALNC